MESTLYITAASLRRIQERLNQQGQRIRELEDLLEWQTNLYHGVGKGGSKSTDAEWKDCLEQSKKALSNRESNDER